MNPLSSYRQRYRLHQAYSQYPRLNLAADICSTACLSTFVAASFWFGYSVMTHQPEAANQTASRPGSNELAVAVNSAPHSDSEFAVGDVEIPAVASVVTEDQLALASASVSANLHLAAVDQREIHESDWILLLPTDKFVIQFGSSPDLDLIYAEAKAFPTGPVAIYPFKKTPTNRVVYGYSSGIYDSLEEAQRAIESFPKSIVTYGPWIRPVGALKQQIMNLSVES